MSEPSNNGHGGGLFAPVFDLLDRAVGAAHERLEQFRVEAKEEKIRLVESILLAFAVFALGGLALALATMGILVFAWRGGFFMAVGALVVAYWVGAFIAWRKLRERIEQAPFGKSAERLENDRRRIQRWS